MAKTEVEAARIYRDSFTHICVSKDGSWMCWVTGLNAPCGCFACNASAQKARKIIESDSEQ
jgi:hypothetical protein